MSNERPLSRLSVPERSAVLVKALEVIIAMEEEGLAVETALSSMEQVMYWIAGHFDACDIIRYLVQSSRAWKC